MNTKYFFTFYSIKITFLGKNESIVKEKVKISLEKIKQTFNKLEEGHVWLNFPKIFETNNPDLKPSNLYKGKSLTTSN